MRVDPARQILAARGFGEGIAAGAQNGDKQRGLEIDFAGLPVIDGDLVARIVDEQLLSGAVFVPENYVEIVSPSRGRARRTGCSGSRLDDLGDTLPRPVAASGCGDFATAGEWRRSPAFRSFAVWSRSAVCRETASSSRRSSQSGRQRPFHAGRGGGFQVLMYGTLRDQATAGDLLLLEPEGMQP